MTKFITCESKDRYNPGVRYVGRFDFSEAIGPKFSWSASRIYARFYGTSVSAMLKSFGDNYFLIVIDGEVIINLLQLNEGEALELTRNYIKNDVVDFLRKDKNEWIYFLEFEHQLESNGYGINFHPSLKTHELMGKYLANFINEILNV